MLVYTLHARVSMMRAQQTLSRLSRISRLPRLSHVQVDPMHVDTLVNYGSLLKSVHNEMATAEKMYVTALQVFLACLLTRMFVCLSLVQATWQRTGGIAGMRC